MVHRVQNQRNVGAKFSLADTAYHVVCAVLAGDPGRARGLVVSGSAKFIEGQRDAADPGLARIAHGAQDRTRIDPGGQEHADFDIGQQMRRNAVCHGAFDRVGRSVGARRRGCASGENLGDRTIAFGRMRAGGVDQLGVPGGQRTDFAIQRKRFGHAAPQVKTDDPRRFRIARDVTAGQQRLDLAGEPKGPAIVCGVQRFDAVGIARQEHRARRAVPQCKGEHAAQRVHHRLAVAGIEVKQDLGIGIAGEARAAGFELAAQLRIIVNLAVERHPVAAIGTGHRLQRAGR